MQGIRNSDGKLVCTYDPAHNAIVIKRKGYITRLTPKAGGGYIVENFKAA